MIIDMAGVDTQVDAMSTVGEFLSEYDAGLMSGVELIHAVRAVWEGWSS